MTDDDQDQDADATQLYVIQHEHGYVKIGKSDHPEKRCRGMQTSCPYELEVYTTIDVRGDWNVVEKAIHDAYSEHVVRGEWFDLPERQLVYLTELTTVYAEAVRGRSWSPEEYLEELERRRFWLLLGEDYETER